MGRQSLASRALDSPWKRDHRDGHHVWQTHARGV